MATTPTTPNLLTPEQKTFLDLAAQTPTLVRDYYFTGGTALAAFYLEHRLSEDIDLFSEQEVRLLSVRPFVKKAQQALGASEVDYRQFLGLHSFEFMVSSQQKLKVDFNYYPFPRIERGRRYKTLEVDSILDIAVNKVHTIAMKPRARDFIDIYCIIKARGYQMNDLRIQAKAKFDWHIDPVQLGSRLLLGAEMTDYPRMLKPIDHNEWKQFFVAEARKLKGEIFK